jgi:prepilin-type N-terminal cleavage/methylation domain-containing protein
VSRGFSLIEAMVALSISAIIGLSAIVAFKQTVSVATNNEHAWVAFTLAEKRMELLSGAASSATILNDITVDAAPPGSDGDHTCASGVDGPAPADIRVDEEGKPSATGAYELCWKVTQNDPLGQLRNIRVVATYPVDGARRHVFLQTIR